VIGAGIMGSGIAQVAAMAGHEAVMVDLEVSALDHARAAVATSLARFVKSERLTAQECAAAIGRLKTSTDLTTALVGAEVVIEAVPEVWELKESVLSVVREHAPADALLATNTSQLSITQLSTVLGNHADRFVGMHFFNPPVRMRLLELVMGLRTSEDAVTRASQYAETLGKEVVVCRKDSPGFITTRAYSALRQECMRMLEEGLASVEDIDTALKLGFNFPMGPFELSDFNGVDTYFHVITHLEKVHGERFRPTPTLRNMVAAGRLGRKTGAGFYAYGADGTQGEAL
jgi:3-hydroxybutyryl-CoA dehydrogenase